MGVTASVFCFMVSFIEFFISFGGEVILKECRKRGDPNDSVDDMFQDEDHQKGLDILCPIEGWLVVFSILAAITWIPTGICALKIPPPLVASAVIYTVPG